MYKLRCDADVEADWNDLPDAAREEVNRAIPEICRDPYGHGMERNGEKIRRVLTLEHVTIYYLIIDAPPIRRVYIRSIDSLG